MGGDGIVIKGTNWCSTGTKYKRSKIAFVVTSVALSLGPLETKLLGLAAQSGIESLVPSPKGYREKITWRIVLTKK